jgi:RNA polymerase sigma-70 factor (ECF subfamily)
MNIDSANPADRQKQLVRLLTQNQRRIFSYIYTLVPDRPAAEDLLQETCTVICEKFHEFRLDTDFVAWACQIAYWEVRAAQQKFARSKVIFDQAVLDAVAETAAAMAPELSDRHEALVKCLEKLHPRDRELVLIRYEPGGGVEAAAQRTGRSVVAAYKALTRLRKLLQDCVTHQLGTESAPCN